MATIEAMALLRKLLREGEMGAEGGPAQDANKVPSHRTCSR